jgi:hypothetical protein
MQVRVSKWMVSENEPYYIAQVPKGIGHLTPKRVPSRLLAQSKGLGLPDMSDPDRIVLMEREPDDGLFSAIPIFGLTRDASAAFISRVCSR